MRTATIGNEKRNASMQLMAQVPHWSLLWARCCLNASKAWRQLTAFRVDTAREGHPRPRGRWFGRAAATDGRVIGFLGSGSPTSLIGFEAHTGAPRSRAPLMIADSPKFRPSLRFAGAPPQAFSLPMVHRGKRRALPRCAGAAVRFRSAAS